MEANPEQKGRWKCSGKKNTNALKHGFYSRRFTKEVNEALVYARQDTLAEIACLRAKAIRVNGWLQEKDPSEFDIDYFTAVNTLANITIAIGTLLRTQALITGKASNVEQAIEQAIIDAKERWILA